MLLSPESRRFYITQPLSPGPATLEGPEAHHLAGVCRFRPGDTICLFNGDGYEYPAVIREVNRRQVQLDVLSIESPPRELPYPLELAAPLPKGDRAQFLLEKLTELGVTTFIPLRTRRSVVHPGEGKLDKLQRYVIEASKQCRRNVLLQVEHLLDWETYCKRKELPAARLMAHPSGGKLLAPISPQPVAMAVGPEGGFVDDEIQCALSGGWQIVNLGPRTLRIETAALMMAFAAVVAAGDPQ